MEGDSGEHGYGTPLTGHLTIAITSDLGKQVNRRPAQRPPRTFPRGAVSSSPGHMVGGRLQLPSNEEARRILDQIDKLPPLGADSLTCSLTSTLMAHVDRDQTAT